MTTDSEYHGPSYQMLALEAAIRWDLDPTESAAVVSDLSADAIPYRDAYLVTLERLHQAETHLEAARATIRSLRRPA